jgi:hypothetical protein
VLGHYKVKGLRTEPFDELLGSHDYICADHESGLFEFMQAVLNLRRETMNNEDSHEVSTEPKCFEGWGSFHRLHVRS